jgi:hypothetical protein
VMTTLPQPGVTSDLRVLQTIVKHNAANAGVYVRPAIEGTITVGDAVWLE